MDEILRELMHLGLSEKEAAVYVAALELGPSSVQDIALKARVNRATTYLAIESLRARGLIGTVVKETKRLLSAEAPDRLRGILHSRRREIEDKERDLDRMLPILLAMFNADGAKPQIRYLEGKDGIRTVRGLFASLEGEWMQIVPLADVERVPELDAGREGHLAQLAATKSPGRSILIGYPEDAARMPDPSFGEWRLVPPEAMPIHAEITVRGTHTFFFSYRPAALAVVIVSKEIAQVMQGLFELAWRGTPATNPLTGSLSGASVFGPAGNSGGTPLDDSRG